MLAGKFKDAEALEQAYIELQKKLGEPNEDGCNETARTGWEQDEALEEVESTLLVDASAEWAKNGELSQETMAALSENLSSADLIQAYMELQDKHHRTKTLTKSRSQPSTMQ